MSIRTKLLLAAAIPSLALCLLGSVVVLGNWNRLSEMKRVETLTEFSVRVSSLIHETQKERGATAGFLGSKGAKFGQRLAEQRELTDAELVRFRAFLGRFNATDYDQDMGEQVRAAVGLLSELVERRDSVDAFAIQTPVAIGYYTQINTALLQATSLSSNATSVGEVATRIVAFNSFLKAKERAGIERAVLANTFAKDAFGPGMYKKFTELVALQQSYTQEFLTNGVAEDRRVYEETLDAPCVARVEEYRAIAEAGAVEGGFDADAGEWFDTITAKINLLKQVDDRLAENLSAHARTLAGAAVANLLWTLGGVITAVGLAMGFGFTTAFWIVARIAAVTDRVRDIAEGEGDLTKRIAESNDELGELARWQNAFMSRLEETIRSISRTAGALNSDGLKLLSTGQSLTEGADTSRQQAGSIATATEQMSCTLQVIAASTEQLSAGIDSVSDSVGGIKTAIEEVMDKSSETATVVDSVSVAVRSSIDRISQLKEAAEEISTVVNLIEEVAEQTNLLALNATIEAARAGEAGKGFAVVATEVKELAKQSAQATEGIRERVAGMQNCTAETVEAITRIERSSERMSELMSTIESSVQAQSASVNTIATVATESATATSTLSQSIKESACASNEVARNVQMVHTTVGDNANNAVHTNEVGSRVAQQAEQLERLTSTFRYSD